MTGKDFKRMIEHCIKQYDIKDTDGAYVCMQWYRENEFYPIFYFDVNNTNITNYIISGRDTLTYSEYCGPQPIWINKDGYREKDVVHKTCTISDILRCVHTKVEGSNVKFLISTYPQNIIGEINPHRTYMLKNTDGDKFIVFCWDSRDSGEGPSNDAEFTFSRIRDFGAKNKCVSHCVCDSGDNECKENGMII